MAALIFLTVNSKQASPAKLKEEADKNAEDLEEFDFQGPDFIAIKDSYMHDPLPEFSVQLDKLLCIIREFVSFSLRISKGHEYYVKDGAWSDNKHFPQMTRSWLENRAYSAQQPTYREESSIFLDKSLRNEVIIVPRKRKMLKACLKQLKFTRPVIEVNQVFTASYMQEMEANRNQRMEKADVMERKRAIYDNLDVYMRNFFYDHLCKSSMLHMETFALWSTFKVANLFKQVLSFSSY